MKNLTPHYQNSTKTVQLLNPNNSLVSVSLPTITSGMVVVIDPHLEDYQTLVAGVHKGAKILVLDPYQDGINQISRYLSECREITSLHIISHGTIGCLALGKTQLNSHNLQQYAPQLNTWKSKSNHPIPILIYGCRVAQGEQGKAFVQQLSQITGSEIAASADLTGNRALGGNWELEFTTGNIEVSLAFEPWLLDTYTGVFATFNVADGDTAGLIAAIQAANDENTNPGVDTIVLATDSSYVINEAFAGNDAIDGDNEGFDYGATGLPFITSEIIIEGNGAIIEGQDDPTNPFRFLTVVGANAPLFAPPFNIFPEAEGNLTLNNVVLAGGFTEQDPNDTIAGVLDDGGAILNVNGVLNVNDSTIESNTAGDDGGAIANFFGAQTTVNNTIISDNEAGVAADADGSSGGGIANLGGIATSELTVTDSEVTDNSVVNDNGEGGGLSNQDNGILTVENSEVVSNEVNGTGEDIFNENDTDDTNILTISDDSNVDVVDNDVVDLTTSVQFVAPTYQVNEADSTPVGAAIEIVREGDTTAAATVDVVLTAGTATAGVDFDATTQTINFAAEQTSVTITIPVIDDDESEATETLTLELTNAGDGLEIGTANQATVDIIDDDNPLPVIEFEQSLITVSEDGGTAQVVLNRSGDLDAEAVVTLGVTGGSATAGTDYQDDFPVQVTFAANETSQTVDVTILDDTQEEATEEITFGLSSDGNVTIGNQNNLTLQIENDDVQISELESLELTADNTFLINGDGTGNLRVTLDAVDAAQVNQILIYRVVDGQTTQQIVETGEVVFSNLDTASFELLSNAGFGSIERILTNFAAGEEVGFALLAGTTKEAILAGETSTDSVILGNLQATENGNGFAISFEDGGDSGSSDDNDIQISFAITEDEPTPGTNLQGEIELIDLRDFAPGEPVAASVNATGDAGLNNQGGLYVVEDQEGTVVDPITNETFLPGDAGYATAALANSVVEFSSTNPDLTSLDGGLIYAPYLIAGGDSQQFYSVFIDANEDGLDHLIGLGNNTFGFEDTLGLGDEDYNDFIFAVNFT